MLSLSFSKDVINWPECEITHCMEVPARASFKASMSAPVPVGDVIEYSCATAGTVPDNSSLSLESECQPDGLFSPITDWPNCRAALNCKALPVPEQSTTHLLPSTSTGLKEYMYAFYSCQPGAELNVVSEDIIGGQFRVQCLEYGDWPANISWPECTVENCTALLNKTGFASNTAMPVPGKQVFFS